MKPPMHRTGLVLAALLIFHACCVLSVTAAPTVLREASPSDGTMTITYTIDAEKPFALGIVESVPEGWTFAETDSAISAALHFEVDRDGRKIAFFVSDEKKISYTLTGTGDGTRGFVTEWVDLCELSPDLKEGKERWNTLGASSVASSASSVKQQETPAQKSPGFGVYGVLFGCVIGACALALRQRTGGDDA